MDHGPVARGVSAMVAPVNRTTSPTMTPRIRRRGTRPDGDRTYDLAFLLAFAITLTLVAILLIYAGLTA